MENRLKIYLDIDGEEAAYDFSALAEAVYRSLKQTEKLSAEVDFVSAEEIRELNKQFRSNDSETDVLSFPSLDGIFGKEIKKKDFPFDYNEDDDSILIGSIAVNLKRASEQAEEYGHSLEREVFYLVCHGLLHLFGYDHMNDSDKKVMREKEKEIMTSIGLPDDAE